MKDTTVEGLQTAPLHCHYLLWSDESKGKCCFNSAFCTDYSMKGGEQTEEKQ